MGQDDPSNAEKELLQLNGRFSEKVLAFIGKLRKHLNIMEISNYPTKCILKTKEKRKLYIHFAYIT